MYAAADAVREAAVALGEELYAPLDGDALRASLVVVDQTVRKLAPLVAQPYAIFGFSLGCARGPLISHDVPCAATALCRIALLMRLTRAAYAHDVCTVQCLATSLQSRCAVEACRCPRR